MRRQKKNQKKHRIFVIEDDRVTRKLITRCLDEAGYESVECPEGKDAIHAAESWAPTAMIVDVMLPDGQGPDIVEEILEDPRCKDIKVVFLTSILANKPAGSSYYFNISGKRYPALRKPIDFKMLLSFVADVVSEAEAEVEERQQAEPEEVEEKEIGMPPEKPAAAAKVEPDSPLQEPQEVDGEICAFGELEYKRGQSSHSSF